MIYSKYTDLNTQAACVDEKSNIWFVSNQFNALFKLNSRTKEISYITSFFEEIFFTDSLYTQAIYYREKIYFIPCVAERIAVFDISKQSVEYIYLEKEINNYNVAIYGKNMLLLFPVKYMKTCWTLNMDTFELKSFKLDFSGIDKNIFKGRENLCFYGDNAIREDYCIYYMIYDSNIILKYNVLQNECTFIDLHDQISFMAAYAGDNAINLLSTDGNELCVFDGKANNSKGLTIKTNPEYKDICNDGRLKAYTSIKLLKDGSLLCLPTKGNELKIISKDMQKHSMSIDWENINLKADNSQAYVNVIQDNDAIIFLPYQCTQGMEIINGKICTFSFDISKEIFISVMREYQKEKGNIIGKLVYENETSNLELLLKLL